MWLFPKQLARGHHWVPILAVSGVTAGLIFADPHVAPYFRKHATNLDDLNDVFDAYITSSEVISVPALLLASGYIRHDPRTVSSAFLCAEAYGDSTIANLAMKAITRRERPVDVPVNGNCRDTFFNGGKSPFHGSSFPSGHTTAVFSVGHSGGEPVPEAPVGAMAGLRLRWGGQHVTHHHVCSLAVGRIFRSGSWVYGG